MRHDRRISGPVGQFNGRARVGERPNLVRLNKDSVGRVRFDPETKTLHVRDEDVVADHLAVRPDALRQLGEGAEVLFVERILHADQMVFTGESDRKSTRLNSSHTVISYAVFCLKKKKKKQKT